MLDKRNGKIIGVSRNVDELGRIVIPKEIRKHLSIESGSLLEIHIDGESIVITKIEQNKRA